MNAGIKQTTFGSLPIGSHFLFRGRPYHKIARNMTEDEEGTGNIFMDETVVDTAETCERSCSTAANPS